MKGLSVRGWFTLALLVALFGTAGMASAQQPAEQTEAEKSAAVVEELGTAAQLIAFGRGELGDATGLKEFQSPQALVAAGGIYLRAHKASGGKFRESTATVKDDDGKAVPAEGEPLSLADEAEALFDEARAAAGADGAAIEALIKQAKTATERGAVGGPRVITRMIRSGRVHRLDIPFDPDSPATVTMRGTGTTQFQVLGHGGKVLWHSRGTWGVYNWHTGGVDGVRNITVKVINGGGPPVAYTVLTN